MKSSLLQLLGLAALTIAESKNEIRDRCCGTTHQKFVALESQITDAMKEGATDDKPGGAAVVVPSDVVEAIADAIEKRFKQPAQPLPAKKAAKATKRA